MNIPLAVLCYVLFILANVVLHILIIKHAAKKWSPRFILYFNVRSQSFWPIIVLIGIFFCAMAYWLLGRRMALILLAVFCAGVVIIAIHIIWVNLILHYMLLWRYEQNKTVQGWDTIQNIRKVVKEWGFLHQFLCRIKKKNIEEILDKVCPMEESVSNNQE